MTEERIYISIIDEQCEHQGIRISTDKGKEIICYKDIHPICSPEIQKKCKYKKLIGITRQEAIEKMAKGMQEAHLKRNQDYIFHVGILAEAALNALLEGKDA